MSKRIITLLSLFLLLLQIACTHRKSDVWSKQKARSWYARQGWLRGCDFIPSTAVNQLEMWQATTFDTATINRELGYAASIGLNSMRVYLHHLAWEIDPAGFKQRVNTYLDIADQHHISTIFVFFDDCWNSQYHAGAQPAPRTGVHNSGWIQDPGSAIYTNAALTDTLERYVKDILTTFGKDPRIILWDLYNEPGNGYGNTSLPLLEKVFQWSRQVNPTQPLSAGVWEVRLEKLSDFQLDHSDVITYHNYMTPEKHREWIDRLRTRGRPLICTEYMARTRGSRFDNIMPMLKMENIGAYNWGLVAGKTNTIYAWDTPIADGKEPALWFHDIFRADGTPYREEEVTLIKQLTGK
ncbi:glycosyl hydrolase family 2 [Chitinophaga niastensis]|uniref:Glycosyl hydrolase family 2 n=1 Tax=Chitinophaga niastensis TaxID=536980 RepID=A0A2P8HLW6_CHINA|nr:glycoside hydrolase family 2 TIM barrel-domain containing protein [Chitinophaga niastensis]PSL47210.1 glycosyl hydrolase family 2 [Chitinophaga niastensis]